MNRHMEVMTLMDWVPMDLKVKFKSFESFDFQTSKALNTLTSNFFKPLTHKTAII